MTWRAWGLDGGWVLTWAMGPVPSSAILGFLVSGVAFGGILVLVVGVSVVTFIFLVVGVVVGPREVTVGGDMAATCREWSVSGWGGNDGGLTWVESSAMTSPRAVGSGWDAARALVVVVVVGRKKRRGNCCTLFPHLGAVGPPGPRVGYIYLSFLFRQDLMAQLARVLVIVFVALGSIPVH